MYVGMSIFISKNSGTCVCAYVCTYIHVCVEPCVIPSITCIYSYLVIASNNHQCQDNQQIVPKGAYTCTGFYVYTIITSVSYNHCKSVFRVNCCRQMLH